MDEMVQVSCSVSTVEINLSLRTAGSVGVGIQSAVTPRAAGPVHTVEVTTAVVRVGGPHDIWITDGARSLTGCADPVPDRVSGLALVLPHAKAVARVAVASVCGACHLGLCDREATADPAKGIGVRGPAHRVGGGRAGGDTAGSARVASHFIL